MNKKPFLFLAFACLLALPALPVRAQQAPAPASPADDTEEAFSSGGLSTLQSTNANKVQLPRQGKEAPRVVFPKGDYAYTVDVARHTGASAKKGATPAPTPTPDPQKPRYVPPTLKRISIAKLDNIRRDVNLYSNGTVNTVWSFTDAKASVRESLRGNKRVTILLIGMLRDQAVPELLHFDADSVSWISQRTLDRKTAKSPVLHYQAKIIFPAEPGEPPRTAIYQAWIDAATLAPLKFDDGDALYTLYPAAPPPGPFDIPPEVQKEMAAWRYMNTTHPHL